jgi:hypothetical protein
VLDSVRDAVETLRGFTRELDPACVDVRTAQRLVALLADASRLCNGATTLLAARIAQTKVWAETGARSPADWVSRATGAPLGEAIGMLETAARLPALPATEAALRDGHLSPAQASAVTLGASANPSAEAELLAVAERSSVRGLRERARTVEAAASPERTEARYRQAVEHRDVSAWIDHEGSGRLAWRGAPDALAEITSAMAPFVKHQLRSSRKAGREETYGQCAADAFVAMIRVAAGGSTEVRTPAKGRVLMRVRVDYSALVRGRTEPGEVCEIEGAGPVPVSVMERIAAEHPLVDAVLTKGRDVTRIAHLGRSGDTFLKAAVEWRDSHCVIAGCDRSDYLETHHVDLVSRGGISSMEKMVRLCGHHHDLHHGGHPITGNHRDGFQMHAPSNDADRAPPDRA